MAPGVTRHVFLDMDETLLHSSPLYIPPAEWLSRARERTEGASRMAQAVQARRAAQADAVERGDGGFLTFDDGYGYVVVARPGARALLAALDSDPQIGVHVFSLGSRPYVEACLSRLGFDRLLDSYHSTRDGEPLVRVHQSRPWVLVDDMAPGSQGLQLKWKLLTFGSDQHGKFIQAPAFTGNMDDTFLYELAPVLLRGV